MTFPCGQVYGTNRAEVNIGDSSPHRKPLPGKPSRKGMQIPDSDGDPWRRLPVPESCRRVFTLIFIVSAMTVLPPRLGSEEVSPPAVVMQVEGGEIHITPPDEQLKVSSQDLQEWVRSAAGAVVHYYGHFPVPQVTLQIRAGRRNGVSRGVTYAKGGGLITVKVGLGTETDALKDDWVLTHEMIHLAFPSMAENHHWIEEGISTYVEPVARAQADQFPVAGVWKQFILDMPKGQPAPGDRGLDQTPTWGRTYWGGAMFCLVADVQIRERTRNRKGLQDSLRAILNQGGVITQDWKIERAFAIGDRATGTDVLQSLYQEMRDKPAPVDLEQLWQKLGVALKDGEVVFNDNAVDAAIRRAIVSPPH